MKPFLLLGTRDYEAAAVEEYELIRTLSSLEPEELLWMRLDKEPLGALDLESYSGIIVGGSGYCVSDDPKSATQLRAEADLHRILDEVIAKDIPFLGICYGLGILADHIGGIVNHDHGEDVLPIEVSLTAAGLADRLLAGFPASFTAFVGHKEGVSSVPTGATLLGSGELAPVQLLRVGQNVYATQFHPELDVPALAARMRLYQHDGYFKPEDMDAIIARGNAANMNGAQHCILTNFVKLFVSSND